MSGVKLFVALVFLAFVGVQHATVFPSAVAEGDPASLPASPASPSESPALAEPSPETGLAGAHLDLAKTYLAEGNVPAAVSELREALRLQPDFVEARASLGFALFNMGEVDSAIEEYRAVLQLQPTAARAHLNLATALMAKHDWPAARVELEEAVRLQPDLVQAYYGLGAVRYTLGDVQGAIESYRHALHYKPDYADAHYNLGLLLKLGNQAAAAVQEFSSAANAGLPKAQYFLGTAYASGVGVEKNLPLAIKWWFKAADQGVVQAQEALAELRRATLGKGNRSNDQARVILEAFARFRSELRQEFPDLQKEGAEDGVGLILLRQGLYKEALPVLIREAYALSEPAQAQLQVLYEQGVEGQLVAHDPRILNFFKTAAAEGFTRPRVALARIYADGLGVPEDLKKAISLLRGSPDEEAQRLLKELSRR